MTAHNHRRYVEGCYRCELNKDEVAFAKAEAQREIGWCEEHGCMAQRYDDGSIGCYHQAVTETYSDHSCRWEPLATSTDRTPK